MATQIQVKDDLDLHKKYTFAKSSTIL
jgi:hypothetical protein